MINFNWLNVFSPWIFIQTKNNFSNASQPSGSFIILVSKFSFPSSVNFSPVICDFFSKLHHSTKSFSLTYHRWKFFWPIKFKPKFSVTLGLQKETKVLRDPLNFHEKPIKSSFPKKKKFLQFFFSDQTKPSKFFFSLIHLFSSSLKFWCSYWSIFLLKMESLLISNQGCWTFDARADHSVKRRYLYFF